MKRKIGSQFVKVELQISNLDEWKEMVDELGETIAKVKELCKKMSEFELLVEEYTDGEVYDA